MKDSVCSKAHYISDFLKNQSYEPRIPELLVIIKIRWIEDYMVMYMDLIGMRRNYESIAISLVVAICDHLLP